MHGRRSSSKLRSAQGMYCGWKCEDNMCLGVHNYSCDNARLCLCLWRENGGWPSALLILQALVIKQFRFSELCVGLEQVGYTVACVVHVLVLVALDVSSFMTNGWLTSEDSSGSCTTSDGGGRTRSAMNGQQCGGHVWGVQAPCP